MKGIWPQSSNLQQLRRGTWPIISLRVELRIRAVAGTNFSFSYKMVNTSAPIHTGGVVYENILLHTTFILVLYNHPQYMYVK